MTTKLSSWTPQAIERILLGKLTDHQRDNREYLSAAIAHQIRVNLRYQMDTGRVFDDSLGCIEEPSDKSQFCPSCSHLDVLIWEFSRFIWNSASRLSRGFQP